MYFVPLFAAFFQWIHLRKLLNKLTHCLILALTSNYRKAVGNKLYQDNLHSRHSAWAWEYNPALQPPASWHRRKSPSILPASGPQRPYMYLLSSCDFHGRRTQKAWNNGVSALRVLLATAERPLFKASLVLKAACVIAILYPPSCEISAIAKMCGYRWKVCKRWRV